MKKNIFTVIVGLLSIFGMQAQALQDTTLTRQLELQESDLRKRIGKLHPVDIMQIQCYIDRR